MTPRTSKRLHHPFVTVKKGRKANCVVSVVFVVVNTTNKRRRQSVGSPLLFSLFFWLGCDYPRRRRTKRLSLSCDDDILSPDSTPDDGGGMG